MPSLLSKFTKSPNGSDRDTLSVHRRLHTTDEPVAPRNPRLVLTSDSTESVERPPPSPRSMHHGDLLGHDAQRPRNNSLYSNDDDGQARRAFADRTRENNRRVKSFSTQPEPMEGDGVKPSPRRPTRSLPEEPGIEIPLPPFNPDRTQSQMLVPARSRHNSTTSSDKQVPMVDSPPSIQTTLPLPGTSTSPMSDDSPLLPSTSPQSKDKKSWRRRDSLSSQKSAKSKQRIHPSGGLASAIAGSGLALVNPAMQQPLAPPPVPRPQQNSSTSDLLPVPARRDRHSHAEGSRIASMNFPSAQAGSIDDREPVNNSFEDSEEDESSPDELDLTEGVAPITGFAVASNKRTADFHALFPTVPEGDYLIDDYGCALQREILIQGRLYISENHICFHASIFGWTTDLVIPIEEITHIDKRMTAYVIPNALQISAHSGKFTFASLLSRDTTYDVIYNIWRSVRPESSIPGSPRGSIDGAGPTTSVGSVTEAMLSSIGDKISISSVPPRKATTCACGNEGKHYTESAMETIMPGEPERIYNLMFASGFIKEFMRIDEKLTDIQISDWAPVSEGSKMLMRNMSYIKPLAGGLGPKQTKCEIKDEMLHLDYSDYITMLTTTRTPDVPSGNVFSVKTRTCFMWAGTASTRIKVTTEVEWTGRSFIRGIIERSCIDGQKTYHSNLERAMRTYIADHKTEFLPKGADVKAVEEVTAVLANPVSPTTGPDHMTSEDIRKAKEKERSQRGLQWALDTVEGTAKVARQSFTGAIELIKDTWESSSTTAVLWFVVVGLVLSNLWTYFRAGRLEAAARRRLGPRRDEDIHRVLGESVRDAFKAFEEVVRGDGKNIVEEVAEVRRTLASVDARVKKVEESLASLE